MKGLEMVKCESLQINMYRITHTGKSVNFPVTVPTVPPTQNCQANEPGVNCPRPNIVIT